MSHSSQSVQTKVLQLEKQITELNNQLRSESDGHTKHKKMSSDYQKVCFMSFCDFQHIFLFPANSSFQKLLTTNSTIKLN